MALFYHILYSFSTVATIEISGYFQKPQESKNTTEKSTSPGNVDKKAEKSVFADFSENALAISSAIG